MVGVLNILQILSLYIVWMVKLGVPDIAVCTFIWWLCFLTYLFFSDCNIWFSRVFYFTWWCAAGRWFMFRNSAAGRAAPHCSQSSCGCKDVRRECGACHSSASSTSGTWGAGSLNSTQHWNISIHRIAIVTEFLGHAWQIIGHLRDYLPSRLLSTEETKPNRTKTHNTQAKWL